MGEILLSSVSYFGRGTSRLRHGSDHQTLLSCHTLFLPDLGSMVVICNRRGGLQNPLTRESSFVIFQTGGSGVVRRWPMQVTLSANSRAPNREDQKE